MARKRTQYKPGDIFGIPCSARRVAYGQILLDVRRLWRKTDIFDKHPECALVGPVCGDGLLVRIFQYKGRKPSIEKFGTMEHWPPFLVVDKQLAAGDFPIIGHLPVSADQLDFPEGTCSQDYPDEYYTFDKGGISVRIEMSEEEFHAMGGIGGANFEIQASEVVMGIDGKVAVRETGLYFRDLRMSAQRATFLDRAGLSENMSYHEMAVTAAGVLPEEMLHATEKLFPGSTCS